MAFDPASGTEGRVRVAVGNTVVAGISEWAIDKNVAAIPVNHFELTADADGTVWTNYEKGLGAATVTLTGFYNVDATDKTESGTPGLRVGMGVILDLLFTRTPFGYTDLVGLITNFKAGTKVENSIANFTATVQLSGAVTVAA